MKVLQYVIVFFISVIFSIDNAVSQEIKTVDGVKTVINEDDGGLESGIKVELIRKIGSAETEDENYLFYLPSDIAEDKEGNLYILDSGNFTVKKFSSEGKFILNFGEWGQGPGELFDPIALDIHPQGKIGVADAGNNRMEIFSASGRNLDSYRLDNMEVKKFFFDKDGNFVFANGINPGYSDTYDVIFNKKGHSPLLYVMDDDGKLVRGVGNVIYERDMYINLVKNNGYFCIDDAGNYYVTYKSLNRIQKHGPDGKILFRSERSLNYTTDVLSKTKQRKRGNSTITDYPKMNKVSGAIAVDSKKRIWVATYKRQI
ncbi:MAG: 6-bladed beta-propeller, partial [bacterium]|nr:6-bladed beta-propeller [bacterium]